MSYLKPVLVSVIFAGLFALSNVFAKTSVWKVSNGDDYFYLGGTVHLLDEADHPLPKEFQTAYLDSQELIFETDIGDANSSEVQTAFAQAIASKDGRGLSQKLSPAIHSQLSDFLSQRGMPAEGFEGFEPWGVALMISAIEYQRIGLQAEYGVDQHFNQLAARDGKQIGELETLAEQMGFLSSLGSVEGDIMVEQTLNDLDKLSSVFDELKSAWREGDMQALINTESVKLMRTDFPTVYDALLVQRNKNWMQKVDGLFADQNTEFVMVGVLHLAGTDGLLNMLQQQGYNVSQLGQTKSAPIAQTPLPKPKSKTAPKAKSSWVVNRR